MSVRALAILGLASVSTLPAYATSPARAATADSPADSAATYAGTEYAAIEAAETILVQGRPIEKDRATRAATKTETDVKDVPQAISIVSKERIREQAMLSIGDILNYVPGAKAAQGEGNRDQVTLRGNNSTADFFIDGVRDDVQFYRDFYNAERVEILKGPNAMIFGRGGGGGVINRVTKRAEAEPLASASILADQRGSIRVAGDGDLPLTEALAARLNAVYENAESFRHFVELERVGVNPTLGATLGDTRIDGSYEYFHDRRTADRGVPAVDGRPIEGHRRTFFGDPDDSFAHANVNIASFAVEHRFSADVSIRNRTQFADYDKFYQNIYPTSAVALGAYNNRTNRQNLFTQTDLVWDATAGGVSQTFLFGFELGRQETRNVRQTGFFQPGNTTSLPISPDDPTVDANVIFRTSGSDADNHGHARIAAAYAQDQVHILDAVDLIAGLRFDRFELDVTNFRNGDKLGQTEHFLSPRLGLVARPVPELSLYASYGRSYLPSSGDQFASLALNTAALKAERFDNYEVGAKWEPLPGLLATAALYQLDRTNTRAPGPDNTLVPTGAQRSRGLELEVSGRLNARWQLAAGYALQDAEITKTTSNAPVGNKVALVPHHQFSLWTRYDATDRLGLGVGLIAASKSYAAISNAVTLPGYARVDAALFYRISDHFDAQMNVENLFDEHYFPTANSDQNISPGAPTTARAMLRYRL